MVYREVVVCRVNTKDEAGIRDRSEPESCKSVAETLSDKRYAEFSRNRYYMLFYHLS